MFFTINSDNNITVHASRKAARNSGEPLFSTPGQFADLIGDHKRLVAIWNTLPGSKPVSKFTNRKVAIERIWKALQDFAETVPQAEQKPANTVAAVRAQAPDVAAEHAPATRKATRAKKAAAPHQTARATSKTATVIELMKREGGVSLQEIMAETGWQAHSVRGFVSGTLGKKLGLTVISAKAESGKRTYSIQG